MNDRLTYWELAQELLISPSTVRAWTRKGLPYLPCGRLRFYRLAAVEKWLRTRDAARRAAKKSQKLAA